MRTFHCGIGETELDENYAIFHACLESSYTLQIFRAVRDAASHEVNFPSMQRADHGAARDNTVSKRAAAVRAAIFHGKKSIAQIENRKVVAADFDGPTFA